MRPGAELPEYPMGHGSAASAAPSSSAAPRSPWQSPVPRSPWQSPVPYLFGGLAAMLGLIALSLLALACSYWKLSGIVAGPDSQAGAESRADGEKGSAAGEAGSAAEWRGHVVVIMAGEERPTFLATPTSSRFVDAIEPGVYAATSCGADGSVEGKVVECEASARPAGSEDDALSQSRSEQTSSSASSVISGT